MDGKFWDVQATSLPFFDIARQVWRMTLEDGRVADFPAGVVRCFVLPREDEPEEVVRQ